MNNFYNNEITHNTDTAQTRTALMFGTEGVQVLKQSHVLVVGCGAVGGIAAEALVRSGIGKITLVDFDVFAVSNLNRQIFATVDVLGQFKTSVAKTRLETINPNITIIEKRILVNAETIDSLFDETYDFVIDAIDSLNPKTILIEALVRRNIPFISAMGAALKTDLARVQVSSMKKTIQCPLASFLRKRLRRRGVDMNFPVVWSDECVADKKHLGVLEETADGKSARHTMGSLMTVTGVFGLMCAHEALLYLTKNK